MNTNDLISFNNNGFLIKDNLIKDKYHSELFYLFYDLAISTIKRNKINLEYQVKNVDDIDYYKDIKILDKILIDILEIDNKLIGELYDTVSYSSCFLKLVSDSDIEEHARSLLGLSKRNTIYSWTHRVRIDPPRDERRTYGWHQEIFYTIPETKFLQTWCPMIRDTTIENGTIEIKKGSHKEGIAKQSWNEIEGRATQIIIDPEITNKYETISLEMKVGDILFFDGHLAHKSGKNSTKR